MRSILFFLVLLYSLITMGIASRLQGAEITFYDQLQRIGPLIQFEVGVCNWTDKPEQVWGMTVWQKAISAGISPVTTAAVLEQQKKMERLGWARITLLVLEGASAAGTIAVTSGLVDMSLDTAKGKALASMIPAVGLAIRTATTLVKREAPVLDIPMDRLLPGSFTVGPNTCSNYVLYGTGNVVLSTAPVRPGP